VKSPNAAFSHPDVPITSKFILSSKDGNEAYIEPIIESDGYRLEVRLDQPPASAKTGLKAARGANFRCVMSQVAIAPDYIKTEAMAGRMGARMMAIVAEGTNGRVYLAPTAGQEAVANACLPADISAIQVAIASDPRPMTCLLYGMSQFDQLFTPRQ